MNEILGTLFNSGVPLKNKISYLNSALNGHTFRAELHHLRDLVDKISELIVPHDTRWEGLALLENALKQCPMLYAENRWCSTLLSILKSQDSAVCKEMACKCLVMIFEDQARNAAYDINAKNTSVQAVITAIISRVADTDAWLCHGLRLIAVCMRCFPNAINLQKWEELREFLLKLLDTLQVDVQDALADCFVAFPGCIARSVTSDTYKEVWLEQIVRIIKSLHSVLNYFSTYSDTENNDFDVDATDTLLLPLPSEDPFVNIVTRAQQFLTLCKCLVKLLSSHSRSSVRVPINQLLELLGRIFIVPEECNPQSIESRTILTMFPTMQNAAIAILESMLLSFHAEMLVISPYITNLFDGLFLASKTNPLTRHQLSQLRCSTLRILDLWIVQYGAAGIMQILQGNILDELRVEIAIRELPDEAPESVKNQKVCLDMYSVKSPAGAWALSSCYEALAVFRDMFYIGMPCMEETIVQSIASDIILTLSKIQNSKQFPFPYSKMDNRKLLYEVLLAIIISQGPHRTFALRHSVGLFNRGLKDPHLQVVRTCQQGIVHCKNIMHPGKHILSGIDQSGIQNSRVDDVRWNRDAWASQIPWASDNQLHQDVPGISETVEISTTYQGSNETEVHNKEYISAPESFSSSAGYSEHVSENQVNGENEVMVEKFQNWRQEMIDSEEEIVEEKKCYKAVSEKAAAETKPVYPYSEPALGVEEMEVAQNSINEQLVEEKIECDELQIVEKSQPGKALNENVCQNGDVIVSDEEMPQVSIQKTENGECSVSSSEENSEEDEEEVEEEEYEEAESIDDSPVKKLQLSSEDLESDDGNLVPQSDLALEEADQIEPESEPQADLPELVETEDKPPASPSLKEMCDTFVLCENKDVS